MDSKDLAVLAAEACDDKKAKQIELIKVGNTSLTYAAKAYCGLSGREIAQFSEVVFVGIDQSGKPVTVRQDDGY